MVVLTHDLAGASRIISYHENKVTLGTGNCLYAGNMPLRAFELDRAEKISYMQNRCTLNANIRISCLHAILGFHPMDGRLCNDQFTKIAKRYMELIGFGRQPYLVYRHTDTYHPHLHIVSTNIRSDGSQIYTHQLGRRLSYPASTRLEDEFGLVPAMGRHLANTPLPRHIRMLSHASHPTFEGVRNIIMYLSSTYSFSEIKEWNALLRPYNILALCPRKGAQGTSKGLMYYIMDSQGRVLSKGIPERRVSPEPFMHSAGKQQMIARQSAAVSRIRIVLAQLSQQPWANENGPSISESLLTQGLQVIELAGEEGKSPEKIILDHQLRCSIHERRLKLDPEIWTYQEAMDIREERKKNQEQKVTPGKSFDL